MKIKSDLDFENLIKDVYDDEILGRIFTENTKIQMKLKINVREYLILTIDYLSNNDFHVFS